MGVGIRTNLNFFEFYLKPSSTLGEAFCKMVAGKKISKKIDYEKLKNLFDAPVAGDLNAISVAIEAEPGSGSSGDLPESSQAR